MNYFIRNRETGKIELHFTKATYQALPADKKAVIKSAFLWSKSANAWVSRSNRNTWRAETIAKDLGLEDRGEEGERLSFAEQMDAKIDRAEARVERMEERADKAMSEWESRHRAADAISSFIPFGQPILVGHHSEKRHRRDLAKIENHMGKAVEAYRKSQHYERRAEAARSTASMAQLQNTAYLERRVKENEKEERRLLARVDEAVRHDNPAWMDRLHDALEEVRDKLAFYREHLAAAGGIKYGKHNVKPGDYVLIRGHWEEVIKCNPTTVAIPGVGCTPEIQRKWPLKYAWGEVKDHRPAKGAPCHADTER